MRFELCDFCADLLADVELLRSEIPRYRDNERCDKQETCRCS